MAVEYGCVAVVYGCVAAASWVPTHPASRLTWGVGCSGPGDGTSSFTSVLMDSLRAAGRCGGVCAASLSSSPTLPVGAGAAGVGVLAAGVGVRAGVSVGVRAAGAGVMVGVRGASALLPAVGGKAGREKGAG